MVHFAHLSLILSVLTAVCHASSLGPPCKAGNLEAVKRIIADGGSDIDAATYNPWGMPDTAGSWTALYVAAAHGHDDIVRFLVSAGADLHKGCTKTGATPLHTACAHGSTHVVRSLLALGADPNRKSNDGTTPAFWVIPSGVPDSLRALAEGGPGGKLDASSVNIVAESGKWGGTTAFGQALMTGDSAAEMADILRALGGKHAMDLRREDL